MRPVGYRFGRLAPALATLRPPYNAADASKVNSAAPKDPSTQPTQGETAPAETNKAGIANGLERYYLGRHNLRVNRVGDSVKVGSVSITNTDGTLRLAGRLSSGAYSLELSGTVQPISRRKFFLNGEISGIPDLSWKNVAPTRLQTLGQFMFEATQGRRYWRMYQVNGRDCVCDDNCGNDFCYIDIEFLP